MKKTISVAALKSLVNEAYEQVKSAKGGANADYIPYLANVPSDLFGIAVSLPGGEIIEAGDTR